MRILLQVIKGFPDALFLTHTFQLSVCWKNKRNNMTLCIYRSNVINMMHCLISLNAVKIKEALLHTGAIFYSFSKCEQRKMAAFGSVETLEHLNFFKN